MDISTVHGIYTVVFMSAFIALGVWVYLPRHRKQYDDAASLPFGDEAEKKDADEPRRQD